MLEEKEWIVNNSPYYNDPTTNIPREIDIIAEKNFKIGDFFYHNTTNLTIRLFIECKYIKPHVVFWFLKKNVNKAKGLAKNNPVLSGKEDVYLESGNKIHHYIKEKEVAKEYSAENNNQLLDKAINQILNATLFFSKNQNTNFHTVNFPIIIVNSFDNFKKKSQSTDGYDPIINNFEIEVEYTNPNNPEYFLIDIVAEDKINDFFNYLSENDIKILQETLGWDFRQREANRRTKKTHAIYK